MKGRRVMWNLLKKDENFWNQPLFWVWMVIVATCVVLVPTAATLVFKLIARSVTEVFVAPSPAAVSFTAVLLILLTAFLTLCFWLKKHFLWIAAASSTAIYVFSKTEIGVKLNQAALFWLFWLVAEAATLFFLYLWGKKNFVQCGNSEVPAQAVVVVLGRDAGTVGPGGLHFVFWPFVRLRLYPTGQLKGTYLLSKGLHSKGEGGAAIQPISIRAALYLSFPEIGREYEVEVVTVQPSGARSITNERRRGEDLLRKIFRHLPVGDLFGEGSEAEIEKLFRFLEESVLGGIRQAIIRRTWRQCLSEKPEIEKEVKVYLRLEPGNPLALSEFPGGCIDVEILVEIPEDLEKAQRAPEIAERMAKAATQEAKTIARKMKAYTNQGAPPSIAVVGVNGAEGKGMSMENIRDLFISLKMASEGGIPLGWVGPKLGRKGKKKKKRKP
jgi:hypothetical protein